MPIILQSSVFSKNLGKGWKFTRWIAHSLNNLYEAINVKRPRIKNHIIFHHDNVRPYVERCVIESIPNKGWEPLRHSRYSLVEAPTDCHVNHPLKNWQANKVCDDLDELMIYVKAWVAFKRHDFFVREIDRLISKSETVIEVNGN